MKRLTLLRNWRTTRLLNIVALLAAMFATILAAGPSWAAQPSIQIGGGGGTGGDCSQLRREITRNWFDVKRFLGNDQSIKRPRSSQIQCIPPEHMRGAVPKTMPGLSGGLKCFRLDGTGVCCDNRMTACATLRQ